MKVHVKYLPPTEENLRKAAKIYMDCFTAPGMDEDWTPQSAYDYMCAEKSKDSIFWTLEKENGDMIGVSSGCPYKNSAVYKDWPEKSSACFYSAMTAIQPEYQNKGYGKIFFSQRMMMLKQSEYQSVIGRCRTSNSRMIHIYQSNGFKEIHRYSTEMGGIICERAIFKKDLNP